MKKDENENGYYNSLYRDIKHKEFFKRLYYLIFIIRRIIISILVILLDDSKIQFLLYFFFQFLSLILIIGMRAFERKIDNINLIIAEISLTAVT